MSDLYSEKWAHLFKEGDEKKKAHADITVVFDRSSSMASMQEGVVAGFNDYVKEMRKTPGDTLWSMVQFDDRDSACGAKEDFPQTVYECKGEKEVPFLTQYPTSGYNRDLPEHKYCYLPRGGTALVDALCTTIDKVKARTSGQDDTKKVIMMVVTDGQENQSREFTSAQLRERIAETQAKGWQYIYLGANQDSFHEAGRYGIAPSFSGQPVGLTLESAPVYNYDSTSKGIRGAIMSGMVGCGSLVSGAIAGGAMVPPVWQEQTPYVESGTIASGDIVCSVGVGQ